MPNTSAFNKNTLILLPLKAYQVAQALNTLCPRLTQGCSVVLLHNGMAKKEWLSDHLAKFPVFFATTSHAAKRTGAMVTVTGTGKTEFGVANTPAGLINMNDEIEAVTAILNALLPPAQFHQNIDEILWRKLAINAVINPLTALNNIANGELASPVYTSQIQQLISQFTEVANASAVPFTKENVRTWVNDVIVQTAKNYSSMHQDLTYKRPTEIDFINGFIVERGNKKGIDVSAHALVTEKIRALSAY